MVDVAVVGGGPAGSAAAILLARAGRSVELYDKSQFPRPKACGEGIMPHGLPVLARLGVPTGIGRPIRGIVYHNRRGQSVSADFERPGLAVDRLRLDEALFRRAAEVVPVHAGARVDSADLGARLVLGADGAASRIRAAAGIVKVVPERRRFGLSSHWRGDGDEYVHVRLVDGGEIYTACEREQMLVSVLLEESAIVTHEGYDELVRRHLGLTDRLGPVLGAGPLGGWAETFRAPGVLLLGDAAGSPDPMTGEGMALALRCAEACAKILERDLTALQDCERAMRELARGPRALSDLLLDVTRDPERSDRIVDLLSRHPGFFARLVRAAAEGSSPPSLARALTSWL